MCYIKVVVGTSLLKETRMTVSEVIMVNH